MKPRTAIALIAATALCACAAAWLVPLQQFATTVIDGTGVPLLLP